ncbi:flagellar hook protein [Paenibacillus glucanolyticus]|uniref:Flagellar hook-associated protein 2 n=1 Tax=Paenibacillus glucanolyticus TaxID=59843 RepID=A0A163I596_9BACL|nr:flagellar filament capping protein FliD [Paenibacillus glucanolyticus]KZS45800.1 flagellar hook protein [Paenibacillus glucanolyticus]
MAINGPTRLTGFSGTLDTDSLIAKLMQAERLPLSKIQKQKQLAVWQREDYQAMNTALLSIRNSANNLRYESDFEKTTAISSNTSVLEVTSSGTTAGSGTVEISKLAASATLISGKIASDSAAVGQSGAVKINGIEISFTDQSTVNTIIKDINSKASQTGVRANYDKASGAVYLSSTASGANSKIEITNSDGAPANSLENFKNIMSLSSVTANGQNAEYKVNGVALTSTSNNVSINGVQVILKSQGTASIGTSTDRSGIVDDIKKFVEQYNSLIDLFSTASTTRRSRDYEPLTPEEKEAMNETQITQWEKRARQGTLYNDSILTGTLTSLRSALNVPLDVPKGQIQMLENIGIKVKSDYKENGKLEIDEKRLLEAVNTNFDEVKNLFTMSSSTTPKPGKTNIGIADRIYNIVNSQMDAIKKKIGSGTSMEMMDESVIGKQLRTLNSQESDWKSKLIDIENRYYKKFAAMEQALQKMNSQSSWLASQLG